MNKETGGQAFPWPFEGTTRSEAEGMTLRDYFAAKALAAMVSSASSSEMVVAIKLAADARGETTDKFFARSAYEMADAMLEARK